MMGLTTRNLTKNFGSFRALDHVSLTVHPGKIHALLGENGAGKSTFAKCLVGLNVPDEGSIELNGSTIAITNAQTAQLNGIGMVHQHYSLIPSLTVLENFILSRRGSGTLIDWATERRIAKSRLKDLPFRVELDRRVSTLSAGEKQRVEIIKQLYLQTKVLILDEPTSVLTPQEADEMLGFVRHLAHSSDTSAILITHKLREVIEYVDHIHVLRKGRLVADGAVGEYNTQTLARVMVGEAVNAPTANRSSKSARKTVLSIKNLKAKDQRGAIALDGVDLDVRSGEILGVAGVSGNGQRELMEVLCGQRASSGGEIRIDEEIYIPTRAAQRRLGVRMLPEEPIKNAAIGDMSVAENLAMRYFDESPLAFGPFLRPVRFNALAERAIADYHIKTPGPEAPLAILSGGNIQRVMLAREISENTRVLGIANPCHGLDIRASSAVHENLLALRERGGSVLLISEDLDEILSLSDRIAVMFDGQIVGVVESAAADREMIGHWMTGRH